MADMIRVSAEGRWMERSYAAKLGVKEYVPQASKATVPAALRVTRSISAAAPASPHLTPLPPAPLAGVLAPRHMSENDKAAEKVRLRVWLDLAKGRDWLTSHQKATVAALGARVACLERGFR